MTLFFPVFLFFGGNSKPIMKTQKSLLGFVSSFVDIDEIKANGKRISKVEINSF